MTELDGDLDRASPIPLYFQAAQLLERAINDGTLGPGERLDDEISMARRLGLSRPTMRRALAELVTKGLVVRRRGVGTQVVQGQVSRPVELSSLYDDLLRQGHAPSTVVLLNEIDTATDNLAARLAVHPGSRILHLRRLRLINGEPLAILENYLPHDLTCVGDDDLSVGGLYRRIRARGIDIRVAKQRIVARTPTTDEAQLLNEIGDDPVLSIERTAYDDRGRAVEWATHLYRANRYTYDMTVVAH